jgi:glycosyltransferase involved in cell wall biosynthesis
MSVCENIFSLVIPAYDEEENLPLLMKEIDAMLSRSGISCEILFVDDGSKDRTLEVMRELKKNYTELNIRILSLQKNSGLTAALDAGFKKATHEVIVSIDSDLQNDPADIPAMLEKMQQYDAVIGIRANRKDDWLKKLSSKIANSIRNRFTHENISDTGCTLKAFKREYLQRMKLFSGMHRFLPSLLEMEGARVFQMPVNHRPRIHGKSKYYLRNRLTGPLMDLFAVRWMKKRRISYDVTEL